MTEEEAPSLPLQPRNHLAQQAAHLVDMLLLRDEGRRQYAGIAGELDMHPGGEEFLRRLIAPRARPLGRREIEARQQAVAPDIGDLPQIPELEDPLQAIGRERGRPLEQPLALR